MQPKKDLAIVLRTIAYEERHKIVTALTQGNGQISAMAKNSIHSRRFGGALDLFAASDWLFTLKPGTSLYNLQEAHIRHGFSGLTTDFEKLALASILNELMLKVAPQNEPCLPLFKLHSNALAALNDLPFEEQKEKFIITFLNAYLGKILQWSGNQPRMQACLECCTPLEKLCVQMELSCVVADAGWICVNCRGKSMRHIQNRESEIFSHTLIRLTPLSIADFLISLCIPIRQTPARCQATLEEHQSLFQFLQALAIFHLPGFDQHPLKSLRFLGLKSILKPQAETYRQMRV